jgi:transglutaminase-like putative cysteine protease
MKIQTGFISAVILLCSSICFSQTQEEVNAAFPGQEVVFSNFTQQLKLMLKNGEVVAESEYQKDLMILSEKNAAAYSRSKIYHSGYNELKEVDAYSKIPDGDKFKKIKVGELKTTSSRRSNVFYDDVKETTFDFPGLVQNAVQHLQYTQYHKDAHLLTAFYLPGSVPVMVAEYTVIVPNNIAIKYLVKNDPGGLFKFSEEKKKKETIYKWTLNKYKGEEYYSNAPDDSYYVPHIIVYVSSYVDNDGPHNFLSNLDDLFKWNVAFTKELNLTQDQSLKKIVDSLITGKKTETEKAKSIYKWVQQHIKYVAFENGLEGFKPRQAAEVCSKRYGDCKDMSSIITQMLRMASIKAYYTWIGTRDIPYTYTELPLPIVDNHMIAAALINNEWVFLDGTDPHANYGVPPSSIQNKEALVALSDKEYKVLLIPVTTAQQNTTSDSTFISFTDNGIKGIEKVDYSGYFGEDVYNALLYKDEKEAKDYVKLKMGKASNKFILGDYKITKVNPEENIVNITAGFEIPGYGKKVGNEYYINLNLEKLFDNRQVDTAKRKIPVEQEYKFLIKQYHILAIPEGYTVTYKPQNFIINNELLALKIQYEVTDGKIIAYQELESKKLMINTGDFAEWNKAAKAAAAQYKEQVVIGKK